MIGLGQLGLDVLRHIGRALGAEGLWNGSVAIQALNATKKLGLNFALGHVHRRVARNIGRDHTLNVEASKFLVFGPLELRSSREYHVRYHSRRAIARINLVTRRSPIGGKYSHDGQEGRFDDHQNSARGCPTSSPLSCLCSRFSCRPLKPTTPLTDLPTVRPLGSRQ